jgi:cation diffusion facilitator CzcD-associated flavoprotein CzcO
MLAMPAATRKKMPGRNAAIMTHDFIIVGGGSAGSVLANRLSAKSGTQVLLLEAGQDTPHGKILPEVLDSYPGTAYFDPRFHWTKLKVRTEVVSHNNPAESPPPRRPLRGKLWRYPGACRPWLRFPPRLSRSGSRRGTRRPSKQVGTIGQLLVELNLRILC